MAYAFDNTERVQVSLWKAIKETLRALGLSVHCSATRLGSAFQSPACCARGRSCVRCAHVDRTVGFVKGSERVGVSSQLRSQSGAFHFEHQIKRLVNGAPFGPFLSRHWRTGLGTGTPVHVFRRQNPPTPHRPPIAAPTKAP